MTEPPGGPASTRVSKIIKAPRTAVYQACLDPDALASWRVPDSMTGHMHVFDAREGGTFRMSLTYKDPQQRSPQRASCRNPAGRRKRSVPTRQVALLTIRLDLRDLFGSCTRWRPERHWATQPSCFWGITACRPAEIGLRRIR
jgi:hypothetical protein